MKKIMNLFLTILIFYPFIVKANIICNDGTISPSCSTCHKGCCSRHGGCTNISNNSSNFSNSSCSSSSSNKKSNVVEDIKSSDTSLKKVVADGKDILISDSMIYLTTKETITILVIANDSKSIVDYIKNPDLTIEENIINIKVTAENGNIIS